HLGEFFVAGLRRRREWGRESRCAAREYECNLDASGTPYDHSCKLFAWQGFIRSYKLLPMFQRARVGREAILWRIGLILAVASTAGMALFLGGAHTYVLLTI